MAEWKIGTPLLITDCHRGIYWGCFLARESDGSLLLSGVRHCYDYIPISPSHKGTYGLATGGPGDDSRIGPATSDMRIHGIATETLCTPEAVERWKSAVWK